jgi:hypothetical protein
VPQLQQYVKEGEREKQWRIWWRVPQGVGYFRYCGLIVQIPVTEFDVEM